MGRSWSKASAAVRMDEAIRTEDHAIMLALARDRAISVIRSLCDNPALTAEAIRVVSRKCDHDALISIKLAIHPNTPKDVMETLTHCKHNFAREALADRKDLPLDIMLKLVVDEDFRVRMKVAANSAAPMALIEHLVHDESGWVRYEMAKRKDVTEAALCVLIGDADNDIRELARQRLLAKKAEQLSDEDRGSSLRRRTAKRRL